MNEGRGGRPAGLVRLAERPEDAHKGDFGRALLIGGSRGMAGAIGLAGMAALRGGAGLVRLAVPEPCLDVVAGYEPSYMTTPLPADAAGRISAAADEAIDELARSATCVAVGPGLGRSPELDRLVARLYRTLPVPAVFDADALNALAAQPGSLASHAGPRIVTPHPGEFARLTGVGAADREAQVAAALELARSADLVVVLKGPRTLVADPSGGWRNTTGNPGMATGGCGDVLTGLLTALICQRLPVAAAARLGTYLHGRAGDLAAVETGPTSLIASDLVRRLPQAIRDDGVDSDGARPS